MPEEDKGMARITVRVPVESRDQIYRWAELIGVRVGHFASMALTYGARHLAQQYGAIEQHHCEICREPVAVGTPLEVLTFDDGYEISAYFCEKHDWSFMGDIGKPEQIRQRELEREAEARARVKGGASVGA